MHTIRSQSRTDQTRARGFTLMELMVTLVVFLAAYLADNRALLAGHSTRLAPLFDDEEHSAAWERERVHSRVRRVSIEETRGKPLFVGIDSGSTTTKVCLVNEAGDLLFQRYQHNRGNALQTACDALGAI